MNTFSAPVTSHVDYVEISSSEFNNVGRDQFGPITINISFISFGGDSDIGSLCVLGRLLERVFVEAPMVVVRRGVL